jgi:hypothetical protein
MKIIGSVLFVLPTKILYANYNVANQSYKHHSYLIHNNGIFPAQITRTEKLNFIQIEMVKCFVNFHYNLNYVFLTKTIESTINHYLNIYLTFLFKAEKCDYLEKSDSTATFKMRITDSF